MPALRRLFLIPLLLTISVAAHAAPLTEQQITGFLGAMTDLRAFAEKTNLDFGHPDAAAPATGNPFAAGIAQLRAMNQYGTANSIVGKYGFASLEDWATIANRVMKAFVAARMGGQAPAIAAQMQQAMQMIQSNPNMTAEQKAAAMQQMSQSMQGMQTFQNADPADQRAVTPFLDRIEAAFDKP